MNLRTVFCQHQHIGNRCISAADNRHLFAAEKSAVTGRAIAYAAPGQHVLPRQAQLSWRGPRRDNQRACAIAFAQRADRLNLPAQRDLRCQVFQCSCAEGFRLLAHPERERVAVRSWQAGIVFYPRRNRHLTARGLPLNHRTAQTGSRAVKRGGISGRPAAENQYIIHNQHSLKRPLSDSVSERGRNISLSAARFQCQRSWRRGRARHNARCQTHKRRWTA